MNTALGRKLDIGAAIISVIVLLVVGGMRQIKLDIPYDLHFLPAFHAIANTLTAIMLILALYFIKRKDVKNHQRFIYVAMGLSVLFLMSYVAYHITTPETRFGGEGSIRGIYFFLLISHIILAALILPFILFTFIRGYTGQIEKHRKLAKWTYPLWLYVAITGPVLYLMLRPYY